MKCQLKLNKVKLIRILWVEFKVMQCFQYLYLNNKDSPYQDNMKIIQIFYSDLVWQMQLMIIKG